MYFWCICGEEGDLHVLLLCHLILSSNIYYRHTLFHCTSLYCTSRMQWVLSFLGFSVSQIGGFWQLCIKPIYQHHFSTSTCLFYVSVSHFGNSHAISCFFFLLYLLWWFGICELWCYYFNYFGAQGAMPIKDGELIDKWVCSDCSTYLLLFPHLSPFSWVSLFPEIQQYWN